MSVTNQQDGPSVSQTDAPADPDNTTTIESTEVDIAMEQPVSDPEEQLVDLLKKGLEDISARPFAYLFTFNVNDLSVRKTVLHYFVVILTKPKE